MLYKNLCSICGRVLQSVNVRPRLHNLKCRPELTSSQHYYATCPSGMKVTVCGAAGQTGQPLSLLLKQSTLLDEIALYDITSTCGYGTELSHVDTKCKITSYTGRQSVCDALKGSKVVVIVARNDYDAFESNAPVVTELTLHINNNCPDAFIIVATEPVESMVPLVAEILRLRNGYNPRKLLGCVELNCMRANTVLADFIRAAPEKVKVPVIGGATAETMVPVLSAAINPCELTPEQIECITSSIMSGNEVVCAAKGCYAATACFSGAYAVARTTLNVIMGLQGRKRVAQCAYVDSLGTCAPDCQFFASEVVFGPSGVEKNLGIPELTKFENCLLCNCLPHVRNEIARSIWLVYTMCMQMCTNSCSCPHPCRCYTPVPTCAPPVNWTNECPDSCRDEYLASICRELTNQCTGSMHLCWHPREADYDAARAKNLTHRIPLKSAACSTCNVPRSVRIAKEYRDRSFDPCS